MLNSWWQRWHKVHKTGILSPINDQAFLGLVKIVSLRWSSGRTEALVVPNLPRGAAL